MATEPFRKSSATPNLSLAAGFLRTHYWKILAISLVALIPCFWHRHIQACDLSSHIYNAWLASLIERGQAPGLYLSHEWHNVLFDILLTRLGVWFGFAAAEKIAVSFIVLTFFWGAFALIAAASGRPPWLLVPPILMLAYGWTFHIGFSNYYLSLGLAFWTLALLWRATGREWLVGLLLTFVVFVAHPIGLLFLAATVAYVLVSESLTGWWKLLPLPAAILALLVVRTWLERRYTVYWASPRYLVNGVDQFILGARYEHLGQIILALFLAFFLLDAVLRWREKEHWIKLLVPLCLYLVSLASLHLLPDVVDLPQYALPFGFIIMRLTTLCAVFALCALSCLQPRVWHAAAFGAASLVFFVFLWQDTGKIEKMELQAERLVSALPPSSRVIATIWALPASRFYFINHVVDRACIGKCFSYSNYEPSSRQFRVRVTPGSPVVADSVLAADQMQSGTYKVRFADLPLFQIEQCSKDGAELCIRELHAGERNGRSASGSLR